jgi:hypothetical protein
MVDEDKTSIKISPFSGKHTDWPVWQEKFLARARRKGYKKILLGQVTIPSDADTVASGTSKATEIKKLRDQNDLAYEALILLIGGDTAEGRVAFNLVKGSKTTELKDGDAALA